MEIKVNSSGGMGVISVTTLVLIILKLTNNIDWSWIWVLCPIWISAILAIIIFSIILVGGRIKKGKW